MVQVYAARTFGWRGAFAVHTRLTAKEPDADLHTRYEVIGWYARMWQSAVSPPGIRRGWKRRRGTTPTYWRTSL